MKKHKRNYIIGGSVAAILALLIVARLMLSSYVIDHVNRALSRMDGYSGTISDVDISLYRGAYTIYNLQIFKNTGNIPVPFVDIAALDLSIQWGALFKGAIVADIAADKAILNFAVSPNSKTVQAGEEGNWTQLIDDLMPLDINVLEITHGKIVYQDFSTTPNVDIYIHEVALTTKNLRNIDDKNVALPSDIDISGRSIGDGKLKIVGKINILREFPDFDLDGRLEDVSLPAMNNYTKSFMAVDFTKGDLSLYSELAVRDGQLAGYIKPVVKDISVISLKQDRNPINLVWETFLSIVLQIFKNQPHDQFATKVMLEGDIRSPQVNMWATLGGIFRNAFIRAFANGTDNTVDFGHVPDNRPKGNK